MENTIQKKENQTLNLNSEEIASNSAHTSRKDDITKQVQKKLQSDSSLNEINSTSRQNRQNELERILDSSAFEGHSSSDHEYWNSDDAKCDRKRTLDRKR